MTAPDLHLVDEADLLRSEVATLRQLLDVLERTTFEQTAKLQRAIEERTAVAHELRQQLDFTHAMTDSMAEGVFAFDANGLLSFANRAAEELLLMESRSLLGRTLRETGVVAADESLAAIERVLQRSTVRSEDARFRRGDGTTIPVAFEASPLISGDAAAGGVLVFHDISARKAAEEERQRLFDVERAARLDAERSREINRFLAEAGVALVSSLDHAAVLKRVAQLAIPVFADWSLIHLLDEQGSLRRVAVAHSDPEKEALFGSIDDTYPAGANDPYGPARVSRTGSSELVASIGADVLEASAKTADHLTQLREFGFVSYVSVPLIARSRTLGAMTFATAESGRQYTEGDVLLAQQLADRAALAIDNARLFQEVQEARNELEDRVAARTAQLLEANRELESFSYSVSHDLRAPIRHISGFADLLEKKLSSAAEPVTLHYLQAIRKSAKHAGVLVDDLLAFSRMGRADMAQQEVDMAELVRQVQRDLAPDTQDRRIEWRVGQLGRATGDPAMLRLVWRNLLSNAVKYSRTRELAVIEIGRTDRESEVVFHVSDNGVGFDMKYVDKLFGVFQRLHGAEQFEGTGIGLANVRRIIARHRGRTWAEGAVERGSTFYFSLPK